MTRLSDGKKTVEITMNNWTGSGYTPDWSADFFQVGGCAYDDERNVYVVPNVEYCVDCARDWENGRWDGDEDAAQDDLDSRCVDICYL